MSSNISQNLHRNNLPSHPSAVNLVDADKLRQQLNVVCRLAEERAEQARSLASQLTLAEHRERQKLAQLLHDDMQQVLVAAKFNLEAMMRQSRSRTMARRGRLINGLLDSAVELTRSLTWQLCPPILKADGLSAALAWLARDMSHKGIITVRCLCDDKADPEAEDVAVLLFQAAGELLLNAAKHSGATEAKLELQRQGNEVALHVSDRGRGFDPGRLGARQSGSHFGLASIRQRIECMGGQMRIASQPGYGACFELTLPAGPGLDRQTAPEPARPRDSQKTSRQRTGARIKLLLVDDHEIVRKGLVELLRAEPDFQVVAETTDGRSAIELARELDPHVVIMDVTIPEMDGLEATRQIVETVPGVKVIGLSMHEARYMQSAMLRAGAATYLNKAGPPSELISAIRQLAPRQQRPKRLARRRPNQSRGK